jgi:hypothetical protein
VDFSSATTAALSGAQADFVTNLTPVIGPLLGIAVVGLILRRVLRFVK